MGKKPAFFFKILYTPAERPEMKIDALTSLLEPVVNDMNMELVELQYRREASGWVLRLIIDKEQGISLDDCADVSREVGRILEVEDPIEHAYRLEVSSPGLDRPLKKESDFDRFKGRQAKIKLLEPLDGQRVFVGRIEGLHDAAVWLATEKGTTRLPLNKIAKARLEVEF